MSQAPDPAILIAQIKDKLGIGADKVYGVIGEFSEPEELVEAGRTIRGMGYTKIDAMSPFPVHGIDEAIGVPYSKIGWIAICGAIAGITTAQVLIYRRSDQLSADHGGKPLFDFTYSIANLRAGDSVYRHHDFLCTWGLSGCRGCIIRR